MAFVSVGNKYPSSAFGAGSQLPNYKTVVYVRAKWSSDWQVASYLQPLRAVSAALPGRSSAEFLFRYGDIKPEDQADFTTRVARYYQDHYVLIGAMSNLLPLPYPLWCGIIPAEQWEVMGTVLDGNSSTPMGDLVIEAHGFEYLLERRRVRGSWAVTGVTPLPDEFSDYDNAWRVDVTPPFNESLRRGLCESGNRSAIKIQHTVSGETTYGFGGVDKWSARQIIEYLLYWSQVPDEDAHEPHISLGGDDLVLDYLDDLEITLRQEGRDVWSMLKELLDRKRGLSAAIVWNVDDSSWPSGALELQVFSMASDEIQVGDSVLPRNLNIEYAEVDKDIDIDSANIAIDTLNTYDQVIVQGAPLVSCFTCCLSEILGGFDAPMEPAWTPAQETAYEAANPAHRRHDYFDRVYRFFRLPEDFDWKTYRGDDGDILNPSFDEGGNIQLNTPAPYVGNESRRILPRLPLDEPSDTEAGATRARPLRPFALVEVLDANGGSTGQWVYADKPDKDLVGSNVSGAHITPHDREAMVEVRFSPNHLLGANRFVSTNDEPDAEPVFDYNKMLITLAVETDTRPSVRMPTGANTYLATRTAVINVPDAQVWIIATETVLGLSADSELQTHTGSRILRDDTYRLRDIAAMAAAIYSKQRAALRLTRKGLQDMHSLGVLIASVHIDGRPRPIESVVTERRWDFDASTTTIRTGHIELDVVGVA